MIHQVRVIFGDTDQMGVVYYGNYLRFFEASRAALWRSLGRTHGDLDAWGVALPVVEAHCRYRRPAYYEDLLDIHVHIAKVGAASLTFEYQVARAGEALAEGYTRHAIVDARGRPRRMPGELGQSIEQALALAPDTPIF
jgi:acyl-CoA thioester hydrolase